MSFPWDFSRLRARAAGIEIYRYQRKKEKTGEYFEIFFLIEGDIETPLRRIELWT